MTDYAKRRLDDVVNEGSLVSAKKFKEDNEKNKRVVVASNEPKRTSFLLSPIMLLSGHQSEVFTCKFSANGSLIASGSKDKQIFLWRTHGECENYMVLTGHTGTVVELHWTKDSSKIVSASTDKSIALWDSATGTRIKKLRGNTSFVNGCCPSPSGNIVVGGGDDASVRIWDIRTGKRPITTLNSHFPITSVCFGVNDERIFSGGVDNVIKAWDLRKNELEFIMDGNKDVVTGLAISPDGTHLLSNAMDNTVRMWDVRAFKPGKRMTRVFIGAQHNFEKNLLRCGWSADGKYVTAGSADRMVHVWNSKNGKPVYKLPGHAGSVNEVAFHPTEPVIVSASSDKRLYLGELQL